MAEKRTDSSIGARIKAVRRARGFKSTRDLAQAIGVGNLTESIIENIEAGRKADLNVSQVLNLAMALRVPVSFLLAPIKRPDSAVDLPNLSVELSDLSASEFDAWLSGTPNAEHRADTAAERNDLSELQALRELRSLQRELRRMTIAASISDTKQEAGQLRLEATRSQIQQLSTYLANAGWELAAD